MAGVQSVRSTGIAPATIVLGTDTDGREHVYRRSTHTVYVVDGPDVEHRQPLRDRHLDDWMAFIAEEFGGWQSARYGAWAYEPGGN